MTARPDGPGAWLTGLAVTASDLTAPEYAIVLTLHAGPERAGRVGRSIEPHEVQMPGAAEAVPSALESAWSALSSSGATPTIDELNLGSIEYANRLQLALASPARPPGTVYTLDDHSERGWLLRPTGFAVCYLVRQRGERVFVVGSVCGDVVGEYPGALVAELYPHP